MNVVRNWLKDADPLVGEPPLSEADAQRMRRLVMAAAGERRSSLVIWRRTAWAAATIAVAITSGVGLSRWAKPSGVGGPVVQGPTEVAAPQREASARRQLQFALPGGTRVIWIFDSDFEP